MNKLSVIEAGISDLQTVNLHKHKIKLKDYQQEGLVELAKRLDATCNMLGCEAQSEETLMDIIDFLKEHYKDFSMDEIIKAIDLNSAGRLNKKTDHFSKFSTEFIGSILNSYRSYRNKELMEYEKEKEKQKAIKKEEMEYPDKDYYDSLLKYIKEEKTIPETWQYDAVFRHLEASGILKINNDEKQMYADNIKADLEEERSATLDKKVHDDIRVILENPDKFKKECRRRFCINHFKNS